MGDLHCIACRWHWNALKSLSGWTEGRILFIKLVLMEHFVVQITNAWTYSGKYFWVCSAPPNLKINIENALWVTFISRTEHHFQYQLWLTQERFLKKHKAIKILNVHICPKLGGQSFMSKTYLTKIGNTKLTIACCDHRKEFFNSFWHRPFVCSDLLISSEERCS